MATPLRLPETVGNQCNTCRLEQMLTCTVCGDRFTEPLVLPCQHLFCRAPCLQGIIKGLSPGDAVKCPCCSQTGPLPDSGPAGYPENAVINKLLAVPRGQLSVLSQELGTIHKDQTIKGFRQGSVSKIEELRRKHQTKKKMRALEHGCTNIECLDGTDLDSPVFKNDNFAHIHCDHCHSILDHLQITEHVEDGKRSVSGPRLKDSINHTEEVEKRKKKKVRTIHFDENGDIEEYDTAPEDVLINNGDVQEEKKKKKKKKKVPKSKALDPNYTTTETKKTKKTEVMGPKGFALLRVREEKRCPVCHKRPFTDICFHCNRTLCNWCYNNHMQPIVAHATRILNEHNAAHPENLQLSLGDKQPGLAIFLGEKPFGYNHDVVRESFYSVISQFLSPREQRILLEISNYRDDDLEPYDAHRKALGWLQIAVVLYQQQINTQLQFGNDMEILDEIGHMEREVVRYQELHDKLDRFVVTVPDEQCMKHSGKLIQELNETVTLYDKEDRARDRNKFVVGRLAGMINHRLDQVYKQAIQLNQLIKCGLTLKEDEDDKKKKTKSGESGKELLTYSGKLVDGTDRLYWGDRDDKGVQLYIKGMQVNRPDGQGNPVTKMPLPEPDIGPDGVLKAISDDDDPTGGAVSIPTDMPGVEDGRVAVPGEFPFSMEHVHNQCRLLYAKYKKNRGRPVSKKLTEEITIRAEPGGENGTPNIMVQVRPRKPEQFDIPPNSEAAAAITEAGGEINSDNYDVEYAVGKDHKVRPYLRPKNRKKYSSFDDFEFDKWKIPGAGSGITADGSVIYGVGRGGHVEIKGDEYQDTEFNNMVMDALDDVE